MSRRDGRGPLRLKKPHARSKRLFFFTSSSIPKLEAVECHLVLWVIVLATFDGHLGSFGEDTTSGLQTQQVRTGTVERERNFPKLLSPPCPQAPDTVLFLPVSAKVSILAISRKGSLTGIFSL